MLSAQDNAELVRSDAGTQMGEFLRRWWHPVALSRELAEPDGAPIRVRVMGEDFVAFRDTGGRVGLVEPRCAHRGADLFFGRNEDCGLRCVYHGWKYDVRGRAVDLPNVPPDAAYHRTISIRACPVREYGGLVWAWLGPAQAAPAEVPQLEFGLVPEAHRYVTKRRMDCNWVHAMEGALDTSHFSFLHMPSPRARSDANPTVAADLDRLRWLRNDPMPAFTIAEHDCGFAIGGARRADAGALYWRITQFMLPTHSVTPSAMPGEVYYGYSWVPIDEASCWVYVYAWHPDRPLAADERRRFETGGYGQFAALGPGFVPRANRSNDYLIDREDQRLRSFTGVRGVAEQDQMAQESQGVVADRTREHLTATDVAVVRFRRAMLEGARALAAGVEPAAPRRAQAYRVRGGGAMGAADAPFEAVMRERFGSATGLVTG